MKGEETSREARILREIPPAPADGIEALVLLMLFSMWHHKALGGTFDGLTTRKGNGTVLVLAPKGTGEHGLWGWIVFPAVHGMVPYS